MKGPSRRILHDGFKENPYCYTIAYCTCAACGERVQSKYGFSYTGMHAVWYMVDAIKAVLRNLLKKIIVMLFSSPFSQFQGVRFLWHTPKQLIMTGPFNFYYTSTRPHFCFPNPSSYILKLPIPTKPNHSYSVISNANRSILLSRSIIFNA